MLNGHLKIIELNGSIVIYFSISKLTTYLRQILTKAYKWKLVPYNDHIMFTKTDIIVVLDVCDLTRLRAQNLLGMNYRTSIKYDTRVNVKVDKKILANKSIIPW